MARLNCYVAYLTLINLSNARDLYVFLDSKQLHCDTVAIAQYPGRQFMKLGKGKVCFFKYFIL